MTVQIDRMNYFTTWVRQSDGTYVKEISGVEAVCSDPDAPDPTGKVPRSVSGIVVPAYVGGDTNDTTGTAAFDASKTAAGIP